jgi:hypothetical protein
MSDPFALGGFGDDDTARRVTLAKRRSELEASPEFMEAVDRIARAILRAMPDYDVEKSFLPRWPDDEAGQDGGAS